jgi:signal transduction histidine kinase
VARLRFEIEDQGIGMSGAQVAEVRRCEGGTGVGLALSRQLLRLMGGDIEVHSRAGEGCVFAFEIELPVSRPRVRDLPTGTAPQEAANDNGTGVS